MARIKYDGVLEAAHFNPQGQLEWVRVYERMGAVFTDRVILYREVFVKQLKTGKRYMLGTRILNLGGKFNVTQPVHLSGADGGQMILVGDAAAGQGELAGVPII